MNALRALIERASAEASAATGAAMAPPGTPEAEVARVMGICNACRYCEGFCAVFPAMTRRLAFDAADAHYLANLCHNCGACLHACQYAPPHDFGVNVPRAMAQVRLNTYTAYAWPAALGGLYRRAGLTLALALALGLALMLAIAVLRQGGWAALAAPIPAGDFYALFPHGTLLALFAPVFLWAVLALAIGLWRFWRGQAVGQAGSPLGQAPAAAAAEAARDALTLRHLGGGHGEGCTNEDDRWTQARRRAHHLTFWGFMLCFASTGVATLYHYALGWVAPYDWPSLPKLLGGAGGAMLLLGSVALAALHLRRDPMHGDPGQRPMDLGFIALLALAALTGLGLWAARGHAGQAPWLVAHLAVVMALFLTLPYGKFAHGLYRSAALLKHAIERRRPDRLRLGGD